MCRKPAIRLSLYSRLFRMSTHSDLNAFADELEDRFGGIPSEVATPAGNVSERPGQHR
ncbi:TRCF domain-containing protein [Mesorhizobium sp. M0664]|uniref:TRCF domain-containing protein n=1 Tax=unclassified Mesorhizobium TaxID=325217 RepID=UPI00333B2174